MGNDIFVVTASGSTLLSLF